MSRHIKGLFRSQATLFPEMLDDFFARETPVRVIYVFVDDLENLDFKSVQSKATGRPSYHPPILLKIYIYGYSNRIRSSRCLERRTQRNVELIWLTKSPIQQIGGQLCNMTKQTLKPLGESVTTILADKGYYSRQDTQDLGVSILYLKLIHQAQKRRGSLTSHCFNTIKIMTYIFAQQAMSLNIDSIG
jgi:transposase